MMLLRVNMDVSWDPEFGGLDARKMAKAECVLKADKIDVMYAIA
ncbi:MULTISPECIES: hypothetical protein [unclassified Mesorhizobium]|nr:hypothetical protein [Mesorhizobium sp. LSJC280B00]ESW92881.1 hypothetical protein X772_01885 [Mesorhizobium sp. LSJC280B00]